MALEVLWSWPWMVAASVILATVCIALQNQARRSFKGMASLPVIGDSVQFLHGPRDFLHASLVRYEDPFTISIMGQKMTVVNLHVLCTAHTSFPDGYSNQLQLVTESPKFMIPTRHPFCRKAILAAITGDGLLKLLPFMSSLAEKTVKSWENQAVVNTVEELQKFVLMVGMHVLWRDVELDSKEMEQFREEMSILLVGLSVVSIKFPGFYFHKVLKTRQKVFKRQSVSRIQKAISKRRESGVEVNDLLNVFMTMKEVEVLDDDICSIKLGVMFAAFAAFATTSVLIPWVVKYLHNCPEVHQRV